MNCPIRARSANDRATRIVSSGGRATTGTSSILLTNFGSSLLLDLLTELEMSLSKASDLLDGESPPVSSAIGAPPFKAWRPPKPSQSSTTLQPDHACSPMITSLPWKARSPSMGSQFWQGLHARSTPQRVLCSSESTRSVAFPSPAFRRDLQSRGLWLHESQRSGVRFQGSGHC